MLKKHGAALNFTCAELHFVDQHEDSQEAMADPRGLIWQVSSWNLLISFSLLLILVCFFSWENRYMLQSTASSLSLSNLKNQLPISYNLAQQDQNYKLKGLIIVLGAECCMGCLPTSC